MEKMTEVLSLTDTQQTSIRDILENMGKEMQALRLTDHGQRPDRDKMKSMRDGYDEQIEAELTAEQLPLFREMLEQGRERQGSDSGPPKR